MSKYAENLLPSQKAVKTHPVRTPTKQDPQKEYENKCCEITPNTTYDNMPKKQQFRKHTITKQTL